MLDKRLLQLPGAKKMLGLLAGITFLQAFLLLVQTYYLAFALVLSWQQKALSNLKNAILIFFLSFILRHALTWLKQATLDTYTAKTSEDLRQQLLTAYYQNGPSLIHQSGTGSAITTALEGIDNVENYLNLIFSKTLNMMITPWVLLAFVYYQSARSGLILTLVFPIIICFMIILGYAAKSKADRQYAGFKLLSSHFMDAIRGLKTLRYLGLSNRYSQNVYQVSENYRKQTMSTLKIAILSTFALDWFTTLSIAILALFLGLGLINGSLTLFPALVVLILAPEYFLPLRDFANDYHATLDGKNAYQDLMHIFSLAKPAAAQIVPQQFTWQANSQLRIQNLSFSYPESHQPALSQLNFEVTGYKKIGIIGTSGSGKSILIDLLSGFLTPDQATIQLDQLTLPHLNQENWYRQIAYLPQKPYIFADTIANNIAFYQPDATLSEIKNAAASAGLTTFIASLPEQYETKIGQSHRAISGGQAQRIALARAFLTPNRHILMLDEPTAHLDIETEYQLKQTMLPLFENHLVFFATHRLHWVNEMDYLLVLKEGVIVGQGTPKQLALDNTEYQALTAHMRGDIL